MKGKLKLIQAYITSLEYNYTGEEFFVKKKDRGFRHVTSTAKLIIREALPIQCVEAVFVGAYLTADMAQVMRANVGADAEWHSAATNLDSFVACASSLFERFSITGKIPDHPLLSTANDGPSAPTTGHVNGDAAAGEGRVDPRESPGARSPGVRSPGFPPYWLGPGGGDGGGRGGRRRMSTPVGQGTTRGHRSGGGSGEGGRRTCRGEKSSAHRPVRGGGVSGGDGGGGGGNGSATLIVSPPRARSRSTVAGGVLAAGGALARKPRRRLSKGNEGGGCRLELASFNSSAATGVNKRIEGGCEREGALLPPREAMAPRCGEAQRDQFFPFLRRKRQSPQQQQPEAAAAAAADASADPLPPFFSSGQPQCLLNHRVLLLAGAACLGALAAACTLLLSGTPLRAITANVAVGGGIFGSSSASRDRGIPVAADAAASGAGGAGGLSHNDFLVVGEDGFVPVPRLREDEGEPPKAAAVPEDAPSNKRWGSRRLAGESAPLSAAPLDFGGDTVEGGNGIDSGDRKSGSGGGGHGRRDGSRFLERSRDAGEDGDGDDDDDDMCEYDFEASEDDGGGICSPLEVVGLDNCPEMKSRRVVEKLLAAKADILRQVVEVLTDPASSGQGGRPDEPLLLVMKLAADETDAVFGAFDSTYLRYAADAGSWSPLPGGFNRWVEMYHRKVLRGTRPVVITVHGDDVCALEKELSLEARLKAAGINVEDIGDVAGEEPSGAGGTAVQTRRQTRNGQDDSKSRAGKHNLAPHLGQGKERFDVPVVLMTLGWDPFGDPTHNERNLGRDRECTYRVLEMDRVVRWFTSHTRYDSHTDEKFRYLPIGFGGFETRNGLPHTAYIDAAKRQLDILETCPVGRAGSYDLLFQCNTLERDPRTRIWNEMTEGKGVGSPIPVNRAPLEAAEMVTATARGIFAVSPPGTGPDCFRHYEMMLEGNIALVPDVYSIRQFMEGLPAFFFGGREEPWGSLTCGRLLEMAQTVQAKIKEGKLNGGRGGLQLEKLTHGFWRRYIRREVLRAGGVTDKDAAYVERSALPMNPHGWTTFRQVGCFVRDGHGEEQQYHHGFHHHLHRHGRSLTPLDEDELPFHELMAAAEPSGRHLHNRRLSMAGAEPVRLLGHDRTPEGCAVHCATKMGGGIGFFGIGYGDECWCDKVPGAIVPMERCQIDCDGEKGGGRCGGNHASTVYVYGPESRGAPFEYMGCFPSTVHVMFHAVVRLGRANTPFMCEALCTSLRYPFFALEKSDYCRCGVMPANSPRSDKTPAYIKGAGYEPVPGPPNATLAAKPMPEGVRVGDPRFECHRGRCGGNRNMWGCGAARAYDLYRNIDPCVLFRDCHDHR
eukprot:g2263.t1